MESEDFPTLDPVLAAWLHFRLGDYDKENFAQIQTYFIFTLDYFK